MGPRQVVRCRGNLPNTAESPCRTKARGLGPQAIEQDWNPYVRWRCLPWFFGGRSPVASVRRRCPHKMPGILPEPEFRVAGGRATASPQAGIAEVSTPPVPDEPTPILSVDTALEARIDNRSVPPV